MSRRCCVLASAAIAALAVLTFGQAPAFPGGVDPVPLVRKGDPAMSAAFARAAATLDAFLAAWRRPPSGATGFAVKLGLADAKDAKGFAVVRPDSECDGLRRVVLVRRPPGRRRAVHGARSRRAGVAAQRPIRATRQLHPRRHRRLDVLARRQDRRHRDRVPRSRSRFGARASADEGPIRHRLRLTPPPHGLAAPPFSIALSSSSLRRSA